MYNYEIIILTSVLLFIVGYILFHPRLDTLKVYLRTVTVYSDLSFQEYKDLTETEKTILHDLIKSKQRYLSLKGNSKLTFDEFSTKYSIDEQKHMVWVYRRDTVNYEKYDIDMDFKDFHNMERGEKSRLIETLEECMTKNIKNRIKETSYENYN